MKKRHLGFLLGAMLISMCVGCGTKSTNTEPTATTQESTVEQIEEVTVTPEETIAPTPEVTEEASGEVATETEMAEATPEATTEPTETPEATETPSEEVASETTDPEQTETQTPEPVPQYTYTDMSAIMYAQQAVNVRDLPNANGNKLGALSTNDEIIITGQCNETGWYRFDYNGATAYVSNNYIGENKVEVQASGNNGGKTSANGLNYGAFNEADFTIPFQIINKGGINVYYVMGYDETGGSRHEQARIQCDDIVGENLGIEIEHSGCGTYYWFNGNGYINGTWVIEPNEYGVTGLFFPYYKAANGDWLGESPETKSNYD